MSAIERCRTVALGGHVARCEDCGAHRHCLQQLTEPASPQMSGRRCKAMARRARDRTAARRMAEMIADRTRQPLNSLTNLLNFSGFSMNMKCAPPSFSSKISVFAPLICLPIQTRDFQGTRLALPPTTRVGMLTAGIGLANRWWHDRRATRRRMDVASSSSARSPSSTRRAEYALVEPAGDEALSGLDARTFGPGQRIGDGVERVLVENRAGVDLLALPTSSDWS